VDAGSSRTDGLWLQAKQYDDDFTAWNPQPTSPPARWSVLHLERATDRERSLRSIERESGQSINRIRPYGTDDALVAENASQDAEINLARASHNMTYTKALLDFAQSDGPPDEWFVLCEDDLLPHPSITSKKAIDTANTMLKHLNRSPFEVIQFGGATEPDDSARDAHPIDDKTKPFVNFVQQLLPNGFTIEAKTRYGMQCIAFKRSFAQRLLRFMTKGAMRIDAVDVPVQRKLIRKTMPAFQHMVAIDRTLTAYITKHKTRALFVMGPYPRSITNGLFVQGIDMFGSSLN
jgi:hypothetical protein